MKRFTNLFVVAFALLFISMPAFGFMDTDIDVDVDTKAQANGPGDDIAVNGDVNTITGMFGTSVVGSTIADGDVISGNHGGHINSPHSNHLGNSHNSGHINSPHSNHINSHNDNRRNYKNHSGNSHNKGIIEQSKNNSGVIVNQQQNIKGGKGGERGGDNIVNASVDNSTTIVEDKREFAPGPAPVVAGFADYVGSETPGYTYATFEELLTFGNVFTESQLKRMAARRGVRTAEVDVTLMDSNMKSQKPTIHPVAKEKTITVYVKAVIPTPIRRGAFITVAMKSVKGVSVECLGKAGVEALKVGANSLFVTAEGMDITQSQHSVAIGPGISFSSIGGGDQSKGVTGGGGLTYSYGVFGKNYKPFQRFMALYVEDANHKYAPRAKKK